MNNNLYECVNYRSDLKFIHSRFIREYDIRKANISILYKYGVIDLNTYNNLFKSSREKRQIEIGLMEKQNPKIYDILAKGIIQAKKDLFLSNHIQDSSVLSIKNDAVFILDEKLKYTTFDSGLIEFVNKNTYTSFVSLNKIELYYGFNKVDNTEVVDVKGIGKNLYLHRNYMVDFIVYILNCIESGEISDALSSFTDFYKDYIELNLSIGYYREFNSASLYKLKGIDYTVSHLEENTNKNCLDISYNLYILRELYSYISYIYFQSNK